MKFMHGIDKKPNTVYMLSLCFTVDDSRYGDGRVHWQDFDCR